MSRNYSEEFKKLIKDKKKVKELLWGSHFKSSSFVSWERSRRFIAGTVNHDGTILDIGCSNGFLLRSLEEWANFHLTAYGIDTDSDLVLKAKELFSWQPEHFVRISIQEVPRLHEFGMPKNFDFIYWNVWDNWKFIDYLEVKPVEVLGSIIMPRGRLILAFYDKPRVKNTLRIKKLQGLGFVLGGIIENPFGPETVAWIEKVV